MSEASKKKHQNEHLPSPDELPDPEVLPEMKIIGHSTLFYWWPVWATGFLMAIITYVRGGIIELDQVRNEWFHPSSALGLTWVCVLVLVILFTNVTMRGIYSLAFVLSLAFLVVLFAWLDWWDDIAEIVPQLSIHMNMGFYLVFSTLLFLIWLLQFFFFDRLTYWRVRPGQLIEEHIIGGGEETYDARGMLFEERADDWFRHWVLGLGAADLNLRTSGARKAIIEIPNVLFAHRKVNQIQRLVNVEPDSLFKELEAEEQG